MIRLDRLLSNYGIDSRKNVKRLIRNGEVKVNEVIIKKDDYKVDEINDIIKVNDEIIDYQKNIYLMLNKPSGYVSANYDDYDPTVFDLIDLGYKDLFCVGRLDKDTEGLLLITNDGLLAHHLMSPKNKIYKKYYVEILNPLTEKDIDLLENGEIVLDYVQIGQAFVEIIDEHKIYLSISEGKYHQVKRMLNACRNEVTYLKRISVGPLILDDSLESGECRYLSSDEIDLLKSL